jgi:ATP-binding cassette, subfamily B, bacterial PglK
LKFGKNNDSSLKSDFIKVWRILSTSERRQYILVSVLQIFSGLIDMVGVISIMPFLSVASNPALLQSNAILAATQNWTGYTDKHFLVLLGVISIVVLIINQVVRLGSLWYGQIVVHKIWWALSRRMFRYYLNQNYLYHLQHSSTLLLEKLQVRINAAVAGVIQPIFLLFSSLFSSMFLVCMLVWAEPELTIILLGIIGAFYVLVYQKIKSRLNFYGKISPEFSRKSFNLIAEALGAIKEIKVLNNSQIYLDLFDPMAKRYSESQVKIQILTSVPGGIVDVLAFGGILFATLIMMDSNGLQQSIPMLGVYALSLRRILPAVQAAYQQIARIRFHKPSLEVIFEDLEAAICQLEITQSINYAATSDSIKESIELKGLCFSYPGVRKKILDSISLKIPKGSIIGIAGSSGAGKTTLVDLILGLFKPEAGSILIDGKPLNTDNLSMWQSELGYVPQSAFIADGTITRNIAFGIPESQVDFTMVKESAQNAQFSEFIETELPLQYENLVGERGVQLSGGQIQRLSIARALYRNTSVLILDEATSALDGITEARVMSSIRNLSGQKTVIMIAHRLTTLQECDKIFLFDQGRLIDQGSYQSLITNNLLFQRMARQENQ